jgi:Fe-S cluster assembly protein SufD
MSALQSNVLEIHTPQGREEAWRFTPLKRLVGMHDGSAVASILDSLKPSEVLPSGVTFEKVEAEAFSSSDDAIVQRIRAFSGTVQRLTIAKNSEIAQPIHFSRTLRDLDSVEFARVQIVVEPHAKATVIFENSGNQRLGEDLEIKVGAGAHLTFISLQEWGSASVHAARHHAVVERDATFNSIVVTVGGSLVRLLPTVDFAGPGASTELLGVYFATAGQFFEHRMFVDHLVPQAKSRVNYKGALAGQDAHTVWIGDVFIRAAAEGTDTYELNRNLLLSDGARADSVPNLEIETGEIVGAGHASTTGRFDDEQLFYLMSRGINSADARRLVVRGFFTEIVSQIKDQVIEDRIMARIDDELAKAGAVHG